MSALVVLAVQMVTTLAPGIPQPVPPTAWTCNFQAADGSKFMAAGTTPAFPAGWDPNSAKYVEIQSSHAEAFRDKVGIDPGEASDWFRDFQVASGYPGVTQYTLQLKLRKAGASIGHVTRYRSTGEKVPYEYYAVGLCTADFSPVAGQERGAP